MGNYDLTTKNKQLKINEHYWDSKGPEQNQDIDDQFNDLSCLALLQNYIFSIVFTFFTTNTDI